MLEISNELRLSIINAIKKKHIPELIITINMFKLTVLN